MRYQLNFLTKEIPGPDNFMAQVGHSSVAQIISENRKQRNTFFVLVFVLNFITR